MCGPPLPVRECDDPEAEQSNRCGRRNGDWGYSGCGIVGKGRETGVVCSCDVVEHVKMKGNIVVAAGEREVVGIYLTELAGRRHWKSNREVGYGVHHGRFDYLAIAFDHIAKGKLLPKVSSIVAIDAVPPQRPAAR